MPSASDTVAASLLLLVLSDDCSRVCKTRSLKAGTCPAASALVATLGQTQAGARSRVDKRIISQCCIDCYPEFQAALFGAKAGYTAAQSLCAAADTEEKLARESDGLPCGARLPALYELSGAVASFIPLLLFTRLSDRVPSSGLSSLHDRSGRSELFVAPFPFALAVHFASFGLPSNRQPH